MMGQGIQAPMIPAFQTDEVILRLDRGPPVYLLIRRPQINHNLCRSLRVQAQLGKRPQHQVRRKCLVHQAWSDSHMPNPTTSLPKKVSGSITLLLGPKKPEERKIPIPKKVIEHFIKCAQPRLPPKPISDFHRTLEKSEMQSRSRELFLDKKASDEAAFCKSADLKSLDDIDNLDKAEVVLSSNMDDPWCSTQKLNG